MRFLVDSIGLLAASIALAGCSSATPRLAGLEEVPKHLHLDGLAPVELQVDLPNFHRISNTVYRGAQPRAEGLRELNEMGVKTIVNLREIRQDTDEIESYGFAYHHLPTQPWSVDERTIIAFLKKVTDKNAQPVFVHCHHGADRTGALCAAYRIVVDDWSKEAAIREMTLGGYGYHPIWFNLILTIESLNVERIRAAIATG